MGSYALILDGKVSNTILWDGPDIAPMAFDDGVVYIEIPDDAGNHPSIGWLYDGSIFTAPPMTDEQIAAQNQQKTANNVATKTSLIAQATISIAPLQDAIDLGEATDDETAFLKAWKQYRVAVNRIDANTSDDITWPALPD
ncbi:tail fiber assembly protein [Pantoea sp. EABMAA-21]|uniref:tail fiber assembly protein n=1 Tax=Pantoea sp. EABMAA-21 TaxID=3043302 RepID=UPI0024B4F916|nr:tail fiber assembly protein [Pantoea sp. EABMAA-21]MDI9276154.1 tail fiber assembly protein [Pantoea sp. EABMAA-21]